MSFLKKLQCKAEEAGTKFEIVPTWQIKPPRRCSSCGFVKTRHDMPLSERLYVCAACGFVLERDRNACRNMMRWSFEGPRWAQTLSTGRGRALKLHLKRRLRRLRWSSSLPPVVRGPVIGIGGEPT
ncbi:MAG: transposase [Paucibacter sp.]|nr:transposase [Roseateles sp.]